MRKLLLIGLISAVGLAVTGVAVARLTVDGTTSVSAAFSATAAQASGAERATDPTASTS